MAKKSKKQIKDIDMDWWKDFLGDNDKVTLSHTDPVVDKVMKIIMEAFEKEDIRNCVLIAEHEDGTIEKEKRPKIKIDLYWLAGELGIIDGWGNLPDILEEIHKIGCQRYWYESKNDSDYIADDQLFVITETLVFHEGVDVSKMSGMWSNRELTKEAYAKIYLFNAGYFSDIFDKIVLD